MSSCVPGSWRQAPKTKPGIPLTLPPLDLYGCRKVGDQVFESLARIHANSEVDTSRRTTGETGGILRREALATTAVFVTLLGFITQFFGLRASHPTRLSSDSSWSPSALRSYPIFCLWILCLTMPDRTQARNGPLWRKYIRALGPAPLAAQIDYNVWIQRTRALQTTPGHADGDRYFGWSGRPTGESHGVDIDRDLEPLCAQSLHTLFLELGWVDPQRDAEIIQTQRPWNIIIHGNIFTSPTRTSHPLAKVFAESYLSTSKEAYQCIIPTPRPQTIPRHMSAAYSDPSTSQKRYARNVIGTPQCKYICA